MSHHVKCGNQLVCAIWARVTHHLVWGPEGDDFNVTILIGDGVPVPQPVKVVHHATATHMLLYDMDVHLMISAERGDAGPQAAPDVCNLMASQIHWTCGVGSTGILLIWATARHIMILTNIYAIV